MLRETTLRPAREAMDRAWHDDLVVLLGEMGTDEPELVSRRVLALLDGLSVSLVIGEPDLTREAAWEHIRALLP